SYFEEALRCLTYRTYFRSFLANYKVTTDTALPHCLLRLLKYFLHLDVVEESKVTLFMCFLDGAYFAETLCKIVESFLVCLFCHTVVHICPLVVLTFCRCF